VNDAGATTGFTIAAVAATPANIDDDALACATTSAATRFVPFHHWNCLERSKTLNFYEIEIQCLALNEK